MSVAVLVAVLIRFGSWYGGVAAAPGCLERHGHTVVLEVLDLRPQNKFSSVPMQAGSAQVDAVLSSGCGALVGKKIRFSWYQPPPRLTVGQVATVRLELRKPWGAANPGTFSYQRWLRSHNYAATAIIGAHAVVDAASAHPGGGFPTKLVIDDRFVHAGLLNAAILGDRSGVSAAQWELFRDTGTIHLMVVSGLHVGVFTALIFLMLFNVVRLFPRINRLCNGRWDPRRIALVGSLPTLAALVYQTGGQAPVLRAALMSAVVVVALLWRRKVSWYRCLFLVFVCAALLQPNTLLQPGFWLSYTAVFCLLLTFACRQRLSSAVTSLLMCQMVLFLCLTPMLGATVGPVPLNAALANLIVVPVMTLITIPLGLMGVLFSYAFVPDVISNTLLVIADLSLSLVMAVLTKFAEFDFTIGYFSSSQVVLGFIAGVALSLPMPNKMKALMLLGWLPMCAGQIRDIPLGEYRVKILDVGQGSAMLVDTRYHRMVIDTGAAYASGFNLADAVVIPSLKASGADRLDYLLISHGDNDHAGGVQMIRNAYPRSIIVGVDQPCDNDAIWILDEVEFKFLRDVAATSRNDQSCTLWISNRRTNVYVSGDIGSQTEARLLAKLPSSVDLLVAPHHGSNSSSSRRFVNRLRPRFVVFSAGRLNRYGHPRREIVDRYRMRGAQSLNTAEHGQVSWDSLWPAWVETAR